MMRDEEAAEQVEQAGHASGHAKRIPAAAEALGYAGGALALAALITLLAMFWTQLGVWGRSGICAAVAVAGFAGGLIFEKTDIPAAKRLSRFLLFLGVAAVGCTVGFVTQHFALQMLSGGMSVSKAHDKSVEWGWFAGMLAVAVSGGAVWWRRRTWLQHLEFGFGVGLSALLVLPLIPIDGPEWGPGLVLAFVGVIWGVLALRDVVPPQNAGMFLSALGILGGVELSAISLPQGQTDLNAWAIWLGFGLSIALIAAGGWRKKLVVVGTAAAGLVMFGVQLVSEVLDIGMGTPIAFLVAGLVLVGGATYATRRFSASESHVARMVSEIGGYMGAAFLIVGTGTLLGEYWNSLHTASRIAVPAVLTAVVYACGLICSRVETKAAHRLSQVLLGIGAAGVGVTAGMIVHPIADARLAPQPADQWRAWLDPGTWAGFIGSLVAIVAGAVTWATRRGAFTQIVTGAACFVSITTGMSLMPQRAFWLEGALLLALGLFWLAMGLARRFKPSDTAVAMGCLAAIIGTMMFQNDPSGAKQEWSALLGIALSVGMLAGSIGLKRAVMLGFGAAGMVLFSFMTVQMYFENDIAGPIGLLVAGVVLIGMAVLVVKALPKLRRSAKGGGLKVA